MVQHDALCARGEELSRKVAYEKRLLRHLLVLGIPFIVGCAIAALVLWHAPTVTALFAVSLVILVAGWAALRRIAEPSMYLAFHRWVSVAFLAALCSIQVVSIVTLRRLDASLWILLFPPLVILLVGHRLGAAIVAVCGLLFFVPLFALPPLATAPGNARSLEVSILIVFILVAACVFAIERARWALQRSPPRGDP
jgi:hypothetical protein